MRKSGILMHISSLPSKYGIGTLGKEAFEFVDFLKDSGQTYWQVLPIGQTSYGDSPYQTFSCYAGNPYFIDLDELKEEGLLDTNDLNEVDIEFSNINYEWVYNSRYKLLRKAFLKFTKDSDYEQFVKDNSFWLNDYSLFMSIKNSQNNKNWINWDDPYKFREFITINKYISENEMEINFWNFVQYKFFSQWMKLKKYANSRNVKIIGDMPIYVAYDSCDVWSDPKNWLLDENLLPEMVAGVPPDYFSETGQLWGNPIYNYEKMKKDGYSFWINRIKASFNLFDIVRIDHFRGFEAYFGIPYGDENAIRGKWYKGPGIELFNKIEEKLGKKDIIAEDLGLLTKEVYDLLEATGFPGMRILQFAFNPHDDNNYLPHNYIKNSICYTGTHDNMTITEWFKLLKGEEKKFVYEYANIKEDTNMKSDFIKDSIDKLIRLLYASVSDTVIIPIGDYLYLESEGRMNTPSVLGGNWSWRLNKNYLTNELKDKLYNLSKTYRRL